MVRDQIVGNGVGALGHKGVAPLAVGGVGAVSQIHKALMRQLGLQGLQHAQAPNAAVKNANGSLGR